MLPPKIKKKTRISALANSTQHCTGNSSQDNYSGTQISGKKGIQIGKGEVELYLQNDTILCIEDPNESTKKSIRVTK